MRSLRGLWSGPPRRPAGVRNLRADPSLRPTWSALNRGETLLLSAEVGPTVRSGRAGSMRQYGLGMRRGVRASGWSRVVLGTRVTNGL